MLPSVGIEPRAPDFHAPHANIWANSLFVGMSRSLDPYIVMLYWFLKLLYVKESIEREFW